MSWDQGVQLREDLPESFIKHLEAKYEELFGEHRDLEYITWFGLGEEVFVDFGTPGKHLKMRMKK